MKNTVELKGDIALIHVNSGGVTEYLIIDEEDLELIESSTVNRLNIDSGGFVQHKVNKRGKYDVLQIHRLIAHAYDWERIGHVNGNKLDCRKANLSITQDSRWLSVI